MDNDRHVQGIVFFCYMLHTLLYRIGCMHLKGMLFGISSLFCNIHVRYKFWLSAVKWIAPPVCIRYILFKTLQPVIFCIFV